jgi:steroid 5-alpha reductase family enzyme
MNVAETAGIGLGAIVVYMTVLWLASLALRNSSIVDIFWGLGFVLVTVVYMIAGDGWDGRQALVLGLVAAWGLRLSGYILWRNHGKGEDFRYQRMREAPGPSWWLRSYFQVFLLQGLLLWVISAPLLAAERNAQPDEIVVTDVLGAAVWAVGFFFEAVGDWQLARFKRPGEQRQGDAAGVVAVHAAPELLRDATLWWGYYVIAAGTTDGWVTAFGPVIMTVLLVRLSGVALLERTLTRDKPEYAEYIRGRARSCRGYRGAEWQPTAGRGSGSRRCGRCR